MSRNGSGIYNLPAGNPVVTGTTITSSWANTTMQNIADGLTQSVASDGQTPMSGALNMSTQKITNLGTPTVATDAANKAYVDLTQTASGITGGTITGATLTNDTIDSTPIGSTTRSSVKATTLDLGLSTQSVAIGQGNASIMKNRFINGAMLIDQRNAGASVTNTASATYTADRWASYGTQASKFTIQINAGAITPPPGFVNYLGITSSSAYSITATDIFEMYQSVEGFNVADLGWGTANAKTVTLSLWVRSSLTGTFGGALINNGGSRSYPFTYTISSANTWEQKSITIAGDTTGTWITNNGVGITVIFGLGTGSTYSGTAGSWSGSTYYSATGATSVVGTSGATWYATGIQFEVGSTATGYEYRLYNQELSACQRYFAKLASPTSYVALGSGAIATTNSLNTYIKYPATTRSAPTFTYGNLQVFASGTAETVNNITVYASNDSALITFDTATSPFTLYQAGILVGDSSGTGYLSLNAEL